MHTTRKSSNGAGFLFFADCLCSSAHTLQHLATFFNIPKINRKNTSGYPACFMLSWYSMVANKIFFRRKT
jgi:hypothetical protein